MDLSTIESEGEPLIIRFVDTVGSRNSKHPEERLSTFDFLLAWTQKAGIFTAERVSTTKAWAAADPEAAESLRLRAIQVRNAAYRLISAHAAGKPMPEEDIALLNREIPSTYQHLQLAPGLDHLAFRWTEDRETPEALLWPILRSAVDLLTSPLLDRAGECQNPTCGWLFIDTSKNHSRRWCDMNDCGNQAKARNFYRRKRAQKLV